VTRYSIQAPNDINRYYAGERAWEVGFDVAPEKIPGIRVLDSGMSGLPISPTAAKLEGAVFWPMVVAQVPASVISHTNLMSDDVATNGAALYSVQQILQGVAH